MCNRPRSLTISLGVSSSASQSCASVALRLAHERVCASPCPPTHILPCADRSAYEIGNFVTGQQLPSEPPRAQRIASASLVCGRFVCTCARGSGCLTLVARAVPGAVPGAVLSSRVLLMRARGVRQIVCGMPRATAGLASEVARGAIAHRSVLRPDGCGWSQPQAQGAMWGTDDPLGMCVLSVYCLEYMFGNALAL